MPRGLLREDPAKVNYKLLSSHMKVLGQNMPGIGLSTLRPVLWVKLSELIRANVFDIQEDPRVSKETKTEANLRGWKSLLIVPLDQLRGSQWER